MKKILLIVMVALVILSFSINAFAYYNFLSPECNIYLEELKEKFREKEEKEIVLEKRKGGFVWAVVLPENDGVEIKKVQEAVYNDGTGKFEGIYRFTNIVIKNPQGWTRIIWGPAADFYPRDLPKVCVRYEQICEIFIPEEEAFYAHAQEDCFPQTFYGPCIDGVRIKEVFYPECAGGGPGGAVGISEEPCSIK